MLAGLLLGHWLWPSPNEQLVHDLPMLEDFDLYRSAENIDFLRLLDKEGVFADDTDHEG